MSILDILYPRAGRAASSGSSPASPHGDAVGERRIAMRFPIVPLPSPVFPLVAPLTLLSSDRVFSPESFRQFLLQRAAPAMHVRIEQAVEDMVVGAFASLRPPEPLPLGSGPGAVYRRPPGRPRKDGKPAGSVPSTSRHPAGDVEGAVRLVRGTATCTPGMSGFEIHVGGGRISGFTLATRYAVAAPSGAPGASAPAPSNVLASVLMSAGVPAARAQLWARAVGVSVTPPVPLRQISASVALCVYDMHVALPGGQRGAFPLADPYADPADPLADPMAVPYNIDPPEPVHARFFTLQPTAGTPASVFYPALAALVGAALPTSLDPLTTPVVSASTAAPRQTVSRVVPTPEFITRHDAATRQAPARRAQTRDHVWPTLAGLPACELPPDALAPLPDTSPLARAGAPAGSTLVMALANLLGRAHPPAVVDALLGSTAVQWAAQAAADRVLVDVNALPRLPDVLDEQPEEVTAALATASAHLLCTDPHDMVAADLVESLLDNPTTTWRIEADEAAAQLTLVVDTTYRVASRVATGGWTAALTNRRRPLGSGFRTSENLLASRRSSWLARAACTDLRAALVPEAHLPKSTPTSPATPSAVHDMITLAPRLLTSSSDPVQPAPVHAAEAKAAPRLRPDNAPPVATVPAYTPPRSLPPELAPGYAHKRTYTHPTGGWMPPDRFLEYAGSLDSIHPEWLHLGQIGVLGPMVYPEDDADVTSLSIVHAMGLPGELMRESHTRAPAMFQIETFCNNESITHSSSPVVNQANTSRLMDVQRHSVLHELIERHYGALRVDWQSIYHRYLDNPSGNPATLHTRWAQNPDNVPPSDLKHLRSLAITQQQWDALVMVDSLNGVIFPLLDPTNADPHRVMAGLDVLLSLFIVID